MTTFTTSQRELSPAQSSDDESEAIAHDERAGLPSEQLEMPPVMWAWGLSEHLAEVQGVAHMGGWREVIAKEILCTFHANAATLPLRRIASGQKVVATAGLTDFERRTIMRKAELRAWAKEHAPDLLGSALLAEAESAPAEATTIAEQWTQASPERKRELAAEAMKLHGTQDKAAQSIGITRQRLATVLRNGSATVASAFPASAWKPHKT